MDYSLVLCNYIVLVFLHDSFLDQEVVGGLSEMLRSKYLILKMYKSSFRIIEKDQVKRLGLFLVGEGGFEPPKSLTTDLQSVPFGHSGTLPYSNKNVELVDGLEPPTC